MKIDRSRESPHAQSELRASKRPRLGGDVHGSPKAQSGVGCEQEVDGDHLNIASSGTLTETCSSLNAKGTAQNGSPPWRDDDKDRHYVFALGENLTSRYKIHSKMGTFGQVLECWDRKRKEMVAIKIVRSIENYRKSALCEINFLEKLTKHDKGGSHFVQIRNWFDYRNHIRIVCEKLGPSLYNFSQKNNNLSFPIDLVREIGSQLLGCVALMHDINLIHTDLKPENVLFVSPEILDHEVSPRSSSAIKLIDFGSTIYGHKDQYYFACTRYYRAPEVILGLGWRFAIDIWSVGCILVELFSVDPTAMLQGETLFETHENLEHMATMEKFLGVFPDHMLKRADQHAQKYIRKGRLNWPEGATSKYSVKAVQELPRLPDLVMRHADHSAGDLIELLQGLLRQNPVYRLSAREALRHPFFTRDHRR